MKSYCDKCKKTTEHTRHTDLLTGASSFTCDECGDETLSLDEPEEEYDARVYDEKREEEGA